ncbi:hypothetical protein [Sphingorhabdus sp. Alg239-R122]|uniref:Fur family transcriptional regulator n=1 Tax=Sphingorhabdus sp. Alg239-R122 TaxID=2305989 RepID=UPI0013D9EEF6|nr:hypothetical protein [Sphingorhabdus sp. Alg239-R122]
MMTVRRKPYSTDHNVLNVMESKKRPLSAYQIADALTRITHTQVYRALDRLILAGSVRKITSCNHFVTASAAHEIAMVCKRCGYCELRQNDAAFSALGTLCAAQGFTVREAFIEISAICSNCVEADGKLCSTTPNKTETISHD